MVFYVLQFLRKQDAAQLSSNKFDSAFGFYCFWLLMISQHEMRRLGLMVNDVNSFTGRHNQCQAIILKRLKSVKGF